MRGLDGSWIPEIARTAQRPFRAAQACGIVAGLVCSQALAAQACGTVGWVQRLGIHIFAPVVSA